jgi:hypothetical protein
MSASLLLAPTHEAAIIAALPSVVDDTGSTIIVQFVRALAVRQARIDASQSLKAASDNERRTHH